MTVHKYPNEMSRYKCNCSRSCKVFRTVSRKLYYLHRPSRAEDLRKQIKEYRMAKDLLLRIPVPPMDSPSLGSLDTLQSSPGPHPKVAHTSLGLSPGHALDSTRWRKGLLQALLRVTATTRTRRRKKPKARPLHHCKLFLIYWYEDLGIGHDDNAGVAPDLREEYEDAKRMLPKRRKMDSGLDARPKGRAWSEPAYEGLLAVFRGDEHDAGGPEVDTK
ncbi:hypothetical protein BC834DRAFT_652195 [Gloeopeniophorella convolvens]|nr:hypothetical protein BC834DRAFT_652195 [Gloeopeniophorella convolvens]